MTVNLPHPQTVVSIAVYRAVALFVVNIVVAVAAAYLKHPNWYSANVGSIISGVYFVGNTVVDYFNSNIPNSSAAPTPANS